MEVPVLQPPGNAALLGEPLKALEQQIRALYRHIRMLIPTLPALLKLQHDATAMQTWTTCHYHPMPGGGIKKVTTLLTLSFGTAFVNSTGIMCSITTRARQRQGPAVQHRD